jgi:predicted nucleic acid-binding protein
MAEGRGCEAPRLIAKAVVLDTDVVSILLKPDDTRYALYRPRIVPFNVLMLSFQTVAELKRWAILKKWGTARKSRLDEFIGNCRVVAVSEPLVTKWAEVTSYAKEHGKGLQGPDAWIASTALLYKIPLASHNRRDFEWMKEIGLDLICEAPLL